MQGDNSMQVNEVGIVPESDGVGSDESMCIPLPSTCEDESLSEDEKIRDKQYCHLLWFQWN